MIDLGNRKILDDGTVVCTEAALVEMLYGGLEIADAVVEPSDDMEMFSRANQLLDAGLKTPLISNSEIYGNVDWYSSWLTPDGYESINVLDHCISKCQTEQQRERVRSEISMFEERRMLPVLRHLIYLVDDLRSRNVLWGVGRGSSVSSYVLYLIGINRIDPLKFGLDVSEFLKPSSGMSP